MFFIEISISHFLYVIFDCIIIKKKTLKHRITLLFMLKICFVLFVSKPFPFIVYKRKVSYYTIYIAYYRITYINKYCVIFKHIYVYWCFKITGR